MCHIIHVSSNTINMITGNTFIFTGKYFLQYLQGGQNASFSFVKIENEIVISLRNPPICINE
jgi:hypothetical protein